MAEPPVTTETYSGTAKIFSRGDIYVSTEPEPPTSQPKKIIPLEKRYGFIQKRSKHAGGHQPKKHRNL